MGCKQFPIFLVAILSVIFVIHAGPYTVLAQEKYPTKPITLTIGYGAGGGTDVSTRPLATYSKNFNMMPPLWSWP